MKAPVARQSALSSGASGLTELRQRLIFVLVALLVYRIGTHIPIPGINPETFARLFEASEGGIFELINMFNGGALERMSILSMGVMPYITASIIMNLMTAMTPSLDRLRKEGDAGRRKITQYTRWLTLGISTLQATAISVGLSSQGLTYTDTLTFHVVSTVSLVTGAMFMMWLGEQITERGVGNGISLLIFAGIVSGFPGAVAQSLEQARQGEINPVVMIVVAAFAVIVITAVVFVERGQRRIAINYSNRQQGRIQTKTPSSHLPLKVNMAGVIPAIFASSLLLAPASLSQWFGQNPSLGWFNEIALVLSPGQPLYILMFAAGIVFFSFFYTALTFNPKEIADNLKRQGAFVPGIRPGQKTAIHIDDITTRLTLFGAAYVTIVCLIPEFMVIFSNVTFQLGGTALLIVVVVAMDFMAQIQAHLMSSQYAKLMEKSNISNYTRRR